MAHGVERQHPLLDGGGVRESQMDVLQEEIREEAFRIYAARLAEGSCRSPQDDWMEAKAIVLARRAALPRAGDASEI